MNARAHKFWSARTKDVMVGLFVVCAALSLLFMALRVSGLDGAASGDTYTVQAHFQNAGGLSKRAKVTMAGVPVGQVTDIALDQKMNDAIVTMQIDQDVNNLTTDAIFSILTAGLLGEKYIGVTNGADEQMLRNGSVVDQSQTQSALVLEDLIGKFVFNKTTSSADAKQ